MRLIFALLALMAFSVSASAQDYQWYVNGLSPASPWFDSPTKACEWYKAQTQFMPAGATGHTMVLSEKSSETIWNCRIRFNYAAAQGGGLGYDNKLIYRGGTGCTPPKQYDASVGQCISVKPTDAECKTRDVYTKIIQFSFVDGQAVLSIDPEIKDECIYDPGLPKNCTSTQCEFDMTPAGNDDMSDNSENPDQELQDYLDELAKKFDCVKTVNGNVGCTNAEQTPPDVDPEDKCFPGYSWSGTTCVATPGGPAENNNSGSSGGGNTGGGDTGGGNTGGGDTGGGDTGGGNTGGGDTGGGTDGDKDNSVEGTACDKAFKCTGDAVACAMAEKQKQTYCEAHELADSEKGFEQIRGEIGDEKYTIDDDSEVDISTMFGEGTRFLPSACPGLQSVSLHIGPLQFNWQPLCTFAEAVGKFGVIAASLFFAVYVGRAFGGE